MGRLRILFPAFTAIAALGCERREANDPSDFIAAETARVAYAERVRTRAHVVCRADAEGGLHVVAPAGSTVEFANEGTDAQADIFFADEGPSQPIRRTISLGFIGDNKLTETPPGNGSSDGTFYYPSGTSGFGGGRRGYSGSGGGGSRGRGGGGSHAPR